MSVKVMVGIPAYNEEHSIRLVAEGALRHSSMVVVVDDGSTDRTSREALAAGATVIRHRSNSGKGVAISTLFNHAIQEQADVLVLIDGDGQHNPDEIPTLVDALLASDEYDVIVGSRFHKDSVSGTPTVRRMGQVAFNAMTWFASGVRCSDSQSGFRAFRRQAFCKMRLTETSFSVESEMQFECGSRRLRLGEVPISCSYAMPPKRNVAVHGWSVLTGLTRMTLQRRTFGTAPVAALPQAPFTVLSGERARQAVSLDRAVFHAPGD